MSSLNYTLDQTSQPIIDGVNKILPKIPVALLILLIGVLVIRLLRLFISSGLSVTKLPHALQNVILSLADFALWIFLFIALLQFVGLNNIALAVTGSFAFVVLGLSQGGAAAISDVIAGLTLARDRDFALGDYVKIGDREGIVEELDLRHTRLRDKNGRMIIIPNATIDKSGWILIERGSHFPTTSKQPRIGKRRKS